MRYGEETEKGVASGKTRSRLYVSFCERGGKMNTDLHIHSTYSDGDLTPREIVDRMIQSGADAFAITDHDEISGALAAAEYAADKKIKVVIGVELSSRFDDISVHILGYNVTEGGKLSLLLEKQRESRHIRNRTIVDKLCSLGMELSYEEVLAAAGGRTVGRSHIGKAMVRKGYCRSLAEAFAEYIGEGKIAFAEGEKPGIKECVEAIIQAGGKAVVAHPCKIPVASAAEEIVLRAKNYGAEGIEAAYFTQTKAQADRFRTLAVKTGMFVTGGSDFHSPEITRLGARFFCPDKLTIFALRL